MRLFTIGILCLLLSCCTLDWHVDEHCGPGTNRTCGPVPTDNSDVYYYPADVTIDVYYESWCGNLDVRKKFKDSDECELEVFLENSEDEFSITDVQSDLQFVIPREDYPKLKEMFK